MFLPLSEALSGRQRGSDRTESDRRPQFRIEDPPGHRWEWAPDVHPYLGCQSSRTPGPAAARPRYSARPDLPRNHGRDALANSMRTRATAATIPGGGSADSEPPCSARKDVVSSQRLGQHCRVGADRVLAGRVPSGCTAGTNASLSILCLRGHSRDPDLLSPTRRARSSDRQQVACWGSMPHRPQAVHSDGRSVTRLSSMTICARSNPSSSGTTSIWPFSMWSKVNSANSGA